MLPSSLRVSVTGLAAFATSVVAQTIVLQAEDGVLNGVHVDTSIAGYSGKGFVSGFSAATDNLSVSTTVAKAGLYDLVVAYLSPDGEKQGSLLLNGAISEVDCVDFTSGKWANASAGQVLLNAGRNTIDVQANWGYYDIDAFYLTPAKPPPPHNATSPPVNVNATSATRSLLKYVQNHYANGTSLISGQQAGTYLSGNLTTDSISWIEKKVGKSPAIAGFDFIDYSPSRVAFGAKSNDTEQALAWDKKGGIVTFLWHWNAPTNLTNNATEPWTSGFYANATTFNITRALAQGPKGADYKLLLRDIDAIAVQLKRLQTANIPILFRFLPEADGGWFWWGAEGPAAAKALYKLGVDRWTNYHKLNNILWVWNSVEPDWYPGDDVVDILSYDSYPAVGDHGAVSVAFNDLVTLGNDTKVVALSEAGSIPDPSLMRGYYANWAWFMTWTGSYLSDNTTNPLPLLKQLYNDTHVITLENIGNFKTLL